MRGNQSLNTCSLTFTDFILYQTGECFQITAVWFINADRLPAICQFMLAICGGILNFCFKSINEVLVEV